MAKPLSFLDLPPNVRARVFHFTNLTRECPIDLSLERPKRTLRRDPSHVDFQRNCRFHARQIRGTKSNVAVCSFPELPVSLLRVSHQIQAEVVPLLYGQNVFKASHCAGWGYGPLIYLGFYAWESMTSLHITLHEFFAAGTSRQMVLEKWAALCAYMAGRITPLQLNLSVDCSASVITDPQIVRQIMEPIRRLLKLKNCAIRLGPERNEDLNNVAKHMSLQATGRHTALYDVFPRFNRLPREIRLLILAKTSLVVRSDESEAAEGIRIPKGNPKNLNLCCKKCTTSLAVCCCQTRRAAYSTTCVCQRIPTPLFYVSRQMYYEATEVCYSHNTFLLHGSITSMSKFLCRLSPFARRQLRMIDIRPMYDQFRDWTDVEAPYAHDWQSLVNFMRKNLSISNLTLSLNMENCVDHSLLLDNGSVDDDDDDDDDEEEELDWLRETCTEIVIPLGQLQGLRSFHVMLGHLEYYESALEGMVFGRRRDEPMVTLGR